MATQSFYEMLEIKTQEELENLKEAFRKAEERGPLKLEGKSLDELVREGEEYLRSHPLGTSCTKIESVDEDAAEENDQ